jgi:hypothetical protein
VTHTIPLLVSFMTQVSGFLLRVEGL